MHILIIQKCTYCILNGIRQNEKRKKTHSFRTYASLFKVLTNGHMHKNGYYTPDQSKRQFKKKTKKTGEAKHV